MLDCHWKLVRDEYKLKMNIEKGRISDVVLARDRDTREVVAIKHVEV